MKITVISERTLIKRINRKLAHEGQTLRKGRALNPELGHYFIVDERRSHVRATHVDLVALAEELRVLKKREHVAF